jgi:phosphosulfolactate synthase (CoM biosynthesis protein A)
MLFRVRIEIDTMVFKAVASVTRKKSIKNFTETATIEFPKKIRFVSNGKPDSMYQPFKTANDYIKVGMPVTIYMGYDNVLLKRFSGYVSEGVEPSLPPVVKCEDEMWQLKRKKVSVSLQDTTIQEIVDTISSGFASDVLDAAVGDFSMKNTTAVKVLQELKKRFGVYSYFIGDTLIVGKPYTNKKVIDLKTRTFQFGKNIIESNLKYRSKDEVQLRVKGVSIQPDNSKIEVTEGDDDGDERTLHYFDLSKSELQMAVKRDLDKFRVDGYEGSITSFGFPVVEIGQKVAIIDTSYDKRNSTHYADEIEETVKTGYRLKTTVGRKVD